MQRLIDELRDDPAGIGYAGMDSAQAAAALNGVNRTETYSRFGSFRTLADLLTEEEYNRLAGVLDGLAAQSRMVADMVKMLNLPGDEQGNGGGIDCGSPGVVNMLDNLVAGGAIPSEIAQKIKTYAQRQTSRRKMLGLPPVSETDVHNARAEIAS